ncbi:MAG: substrate-binding domain-containing protein [Angelakisella sp.]
MKRTERNLLVGVSLVLVLLFILSSTDLVLTEKKSEVYVVSVLIDDDSNKSWDNFRMGVDNAAEKWNADVSFVTLYDKGSTEQQQQLLSREVENGADAIVLSPTDCSAILNAVDDVPVSIPIISLGAKLDSPRVRSVITSDSSAMGTALGNQIAADNESKSFSQVLEVTYRHNRTDTTLLSDSLGSALPHGLPMQKVTVSSSAEMDDLIMYIETLTEPTAIVATDSATLLSVAERLSPLEKQNISIYGTGWSGNLLRYIESGVISDVGVYSDYDLGYLSIEAAVKSLLGETITAEYTVNQALIAAEDIHSKKYEMMLFPIV